jgi:hypothetical protein
MVTYSSPLTTGEKLTATRLNELFNRFKTSSFTLTWTNLTPGSGALSEGWYSVVNDWCLWGFRLQFGSTPSVASIASLNLPVTAYTGGGTSLQASLGSWLFRDSSASDHYGGSIGVFSSGGTDCSFAGTWNGSAPSRRITTGQPVTVAVDDVLSGGGCYRIA